MSELYANIWTDLEVLKYLENYANVVTIKTRINGGLEVDVKSKAFHTDPSDYSRIKGFLRRNGFSSFVGVHTRPPVLETVRGDDFNKSYTLPDDVLSELVNKLKYD